MAHPSTTSHCITPQLFSGSLTANDVSATEKLGRSRVEYDETYGYQKYLYVQNSTGTDLADGNVCYWANDYFNKVTITDTLYNKKAGVAFSALAASQYGWIQIFGYHDAVKTNGDDDISDGDSLIYSTTDGTVDSIAAGATLTEIPFGVAVNNDINTDDTVAAMLQLQVIA